MSAGIEVKEFKHIPGKNDAEYIKLLEEHSERWKQIANSAISKLKKMSAERPEITRSIGGLVGYTGEPCPNCGRLRVERYESGLEICEKCNWCEQTKSYWLD